ncbi:hypothetical protein SCA6_003086 [Theobroma cacao]
MKKTLMKPSRTRISSLDYLPATLLIRVKKEVGRWVTRVNPVLAKLIMRKRLDSARLQGNVKYETLQAIAV